MSVKAEAGVTILSWIMIQVPELPIAQAITDTSSWDALARQVVAAIVAMAITIASRFAYEWISKKFKTKSKKDNET